MRAGTATWRTSSFESGTSLSLGSRPKPAGDQPEQSDDARPRADDGEHHQHGGKPRGRRPPPRMPQQADRLDRAHDGPADRRPADDDEPDAEPADRPGLGPGAEHEDPPKEEDRRV